MMAKLSLFRQKFRHAPRYQRILSYTIVGYLFYALLLGLLTPYLIETKAPEKISTLLDRPVHLKDVSINPFTLNVKLRGFEIQTREQQNFAGIDELTVKFNLWKSIFNLSINFETVTIKHAFANIEKLDQTQFNFSDILSHLAAQASQQPAATEAKHDAEAPSTLPHIQIAAITIQDTEINYLDHPTGAKLNYPAINFELTQFDSLAQLNSLMQDNSLAQDSNAAFSNSPELINSIELTNDPEVNYNAYNLHIQGADNSSIITQGQFQVLPLKAAGNLVLKQIELTTFWPFIAQQLTAQLQTGVIDFASDYSLTTAEQDLQLVTGEGQFSLRTLKFTAADKALINLPLLTVAGIKLNLQEQEVTLDNISTDGLQLHAQLEKHGVDLARLFTPKSTTPETIVPSTTTNATESQPATVAATTEATPVIKTDTPTANVNVTDTEDNRWLVTIGGFDLTNYDINLVESMVTEATQWRIYPLNFATKMITSSFNAPIEYELAVTVNNQGDFTSQGKIDVKKQSIDAQINLDKLNLVQFQPYVKPYINIVLHSGLFTTKGDLYADAQGDARFQGELQLNELAISDTKLDKTLVKWQAFTINQLTFDQLAHSLLIDHIALTQLYSQVIVLKDSSSNFSDLIVASKSSEDDAKTETETAPSPELASAPVADKAEDNMLIEINKITLSQGAVNFIDNSLKPKFVATLEQLEGTVGKISSTATKNAELDIKGIANKYAPMTLKGEVNPLVHQPYVNVEFIFDNFELPSMTPYSGTYTGLDIDEGQLSLSLKYKLENDQLDGSNRIYIDQLDMNDSKDSDAGTLLPISLAIPLLKNSQGLIDLGVHVSGNINEPSFDVAEIVITSLTNIIMKAATAPFSFLASIVDSTEELDKVNFQPNSALLSPDEQGKLTTLAEALAQRPEIKLNIKGSFDSKIDRDTMANQALNQQLALLSNTTTQASLNAANLPGSGAVIHALVKVYKQETQKDPQLLRSQLATQQPTLTSADLDQLWHSSLYQQTSAAKTITTEQLRSLAKSRADAIKTYLRDVANVGSGRIFVLSHQKDVPSESTQTVLTMAIK